jgi:hypothetical protein
MRECRIEVLAADVDGVVVSIWCDTCKENVALAPAFTIEEVVATANGHHRVMARARQLARIFP